MAGEVLYNLGLNKTLLCEIKVRHIRYFAINISISAPKRNQAQYFLVSMQTCQPPVSNSNVYLTSALYFYLLTVTITFTVLLLYIYIT